MSAFRIVEHTIPAQHIRQYRQATANSQEDVLYLSVKQYIPIANPEPKPGDVTIIGAHANAFPKECYEPLWDDLHAQSKTQGWRIRSIWIADIAHQGQSGLLNQENLGNDPSWLDHSRDLLHLINRKRTEMPQPIIGIGHSVGGPQLAYLSIIHPRLLSSLILLDPTIGVPYGDPRAGWSAVQSLARLSTFRRDAWPSREAAIAAFQKSPFYKAWDSRVLHKWNEFGLRDMPTTLPPRSQPPEVTLTTKKLQEVYTFLRANFKRHGTNGNPPDRTTHPDVDPARDYEFPFYRPESQWIYNRLPELRPSVLWIFGGTSPLSNNEMNERKLAQTGSGIGGSGGTAEGRVKGVTLEGVGHLIPMEAVSRTAEESAKWIDGEMRRFEEEDMAWQKEWKAKSLKSKQEIDETWKEMIGGGKQKKEGKL